MNKNSAINNLLKITSLILLSVICCNAQEKNNLQVFNELVDSSISQAVSFIPDSVKKIKFESDNGTFAIFNSEVISGLSKRGYMLVTESNSFEFQYVIKDAGTSYGEIYRDGFLGDYYVLRKIILSGSFNFSGKTVYTGDFDYSSQDTIKAENVVSLENSAYPFTRGKLPAEPFFSGILEPAIVIGTAALAVILFFTIRSK